jgi:hypothetical protein
MKMVANSVIVPAMTTEPPLIGPAPTCTRVGDGAVPLRELVGGTLGALGLGAAGSAAGVTAAVDAMQPKILFGS